MYVNWVWLQGIGIAILGAAVLIETGIRYDARLEAEDEEEPNDEKPEDEERPNDE